MTGINAAGNVLGLIAFLVTAIYGIRYARSQGTRAELDAKDAAIRTNEQTIAALNQRVDGLEEIVKRVPALEDAVADWEERYRTLERYAAPEAFKEILRRLDDLANVGP